MIDVQVMENGSEFPLKKVLSLGTLPERFVIGIHGKARSGKDTFAQALCDTDFYTERDELGALTVLRLYQYSFAAPLKAMLQIGLGLHDKADELAEELYGVSYRHLGQTLGTEWGRNFVSEDLWVNILDNTWRKNKRRGIVVSDVRFENEAAWVRENGILIHIIRPDLEEIKENNHASEAGVVRKTGDIIVCNSETELALIQAAQTGIKALIVTLLCSL